LTGAAHLAKARRVNPRQLQAKLKPSRALALAVLPLALAACAGPSITTPIDGEPVCPDFQVGAAHTKMGGGLRFPVQVTIKKSGTAVFKTTIVGRRTDKDLPSRVLLTDDDQKYTVEWAQCENERAPSPVDVSGRDTKSTAKYECGKSEPYQTTELTTTKGDAKSHALTFPPPPNTVCSTAPATSAATPDAGAADAAPESTDAAAEDAGAGAAAAATDAGTASDVDAGDAGTGDAGTGNAGSDAGAQNDAGASKSK